MFISIKSNATAIYTSDRLRASFPGNMAKTLKNLEGQTVEVDEEWLYPDCFKLLDGTKIEEKYVDAIIDDARPFNKRCGDCGHTVPKEDDRCELCECEEFTSLEKDDKAVVPVRIRK